MTITLCYHINYIHPSIVLIMSYMMSYVIWHVIWSCHHDVIWHVSYVIMYDMSYVIYHMTCHVIWCHMMSYVIWHHVTWHVIWWSDICDGHVILPKGMTNIKIRSVRLGNNPDPGHMSSGWHNRNKWSSFNPDHHDMIIYIRTCVCMSWCHHVWHVIWWHMICHMSYAIMYGMSYMSYMHVICDMSCHMTISYVMVMSLLPKGMSMRLSHICHIWCHMWHVMSYDHLICDGYERNEYVIDFDCVILIQIQILGLDLSG